ncbi:PREDICTED: serine protease gd isoform X2 [Rhagoletis zephyria]|uniref:serine protease gd isoform X2 n=1 Tax=Rhagoletis zephyria TaxID=28612 RepID=UPI00081189FB|nr:PREDICTED: serine protease gd isoform X2 [Rhagoletis zephyria]
MNLHIATIFICILQRINPVSPQGIPISPCPKIFQYRFDGAEWFGVLSVHNPDPSEALQVKVTLSMRGKPTTNYLGEIELLSRGQYHSDAPVLYKIKFPRTHFPPKVLQVTANNHIICVDHSIFVTQIQLEHTRKFTFIGDDEPSDTAPEDAQFSAATLMDDDEEEDDDIQFIATDTKFNAEHSSSAHAEIPPPKHTSIQSICGKIDMRIHSRSQLSASKFTDHNARPLATHPNEQKQQRSAMDKLAAATSAQMSKVQVNMFAPSIPPLATARTVPALSPGMAGSDQNVTHFVDTNSTLTTLPPNTVLTRGAWPWLAAIYVNNLTSLAYQCAGTLVSSRVVISSAHCFRLHKQRYTANEVLVFLGRHNLRNWNEEHSIAAPVSEIYLHPDYNAALGTYDADIAVLVLKHQVRFNTYIRPACLWSGAVELEYIIGERALIVGWGISKMHSDSAFVGSRPAIAAVPRIIQASIVSNEMCFASKPQLHSLTSNRTFCAGLMLPRGQLTSRAVDERTGVGPCTGDSGAGLLLKRNNRWLLRGTVSATLPSKQNKCISNQYVIYADVAKFLDWIMAFTI